MPKNPFENLNKLSRINPTIQKVVTVQESKRANEKSYMLWLNKDILKQLKIRAVEQNTNIKKLIEDALKAYLSI